MALLTTAVLKTWLKITSANHDTLLTEIVAKTNAFIDGALNRVLNKTTYYEVYSGTGMREMALNHYPVKTLTKISNSLNFEDRTYDDTLTINLFIYDSGILYYKDSVFVMGNLNYYIEYDAGYDIDYPLDLGMVAIDLASKKFNDVEEKRQGVTSKNLMTENITFIISDLSKNDVEILNRYRAHPGRQGIPVAQFSAAT